MSGIVVAMISIRSDSRSLREGHRENLRLIAVNAQHLCVTLTNLRGATAQP